MMMMILMIRMIKTIRSYDKQKKQKQNYTYIGNVKKENPLKKYDIIQLQKEKK